MKIGDSVYLEIADGTTQQQALNTVTSCSACRKNIKRIKENTSKKYNVTSEIVEVTTSYYSALTPLNLESVTRLIKVTKTNHYTL